jgi:intraflagellar transport protein 46
LRKYFLSFSPTQPHDIEIEAKLKPFIPDYIPAIGEIDAFVKVWLSKMIRR